MDAAVFSTKDLTKTYRSGDTEIAALRGVDVDIFSGEVVVLLGPSGSGKSTFLNIIGGLDVPSSGHVMFNGVDIASFDEAALTNFRRHNLGFVFQAYNLVPSLTALENVQLIVEISERSIPPKQALASVGLEHRLDHFPAQLSGGEQQRVAIARALAKQPQVLLCDEPTGALDSQTGLKVLNALIDVNQMYATTCIIITHNASIAKLAHRIIYFNDGQVSHIESGLTPQTTYQVDW
ncbi:ABC transporter [Alteromonadales bacterium alter-6D02]|nr:ABC transporter [Alteromonadales bacterium alter-6D02]